MKPQNNRTGLLRVELGERSYDIHIEHGLLARMGQAVRQRYAGDRIFILTDNNVAPLYAELVKQSLRDAGFETGLLVLPAGEPTKAFETLPVIYDALLAFGLSRGELILTLGGGVIGDLGGFAASTYLRGVPFIQVPTTLLAQVDSSIGGKVAVDLPHGKNLVGSFYQPTAVLIDPNVLQTLPDRYFHDGMAEVIKTAAIRDAELFGLLEKYPSRMAVTEHIGRVVLSCCRVKKTVVEHDERDTGERMLLNFGHTLGHAIETVEKYAGHSHGEAVSIGMSTTTRLGEERGLTAKHTAQRLDSLLMAFGLPLTATIPIESLINIMKRDKKMVSGRFRLVLLRQIGDAFLYETPLSFFNDGRPVLSGQWPGG